VASPAISTRRHPSPWQPFLDLIPGSVGHCLRGGEVLPYRTTGGVQAFVAAPPRNARPTAARTESRSTSRGAWYNVAGRGAINVDPPNDFGSSRSVRKTARSPWPEWGVGSSPSHDGPVIWPDLCGADGSLGHLRRTVYNASSGMVPLVYLIGRGHESSRTPYAQMAKSIPWPDQLFPTSNRGIRPFFSASSRVGPSCSTTCWVRPPLYVFFAAGDDQMIFPVRRAGSGRSSSWQSTLS
jgi:hypothetical protein